MLLCEHALAHIPADYRDLGLSQVVRNNHVVWDPGKLSESRHLSASLDVPLIVGGVSHLVFDCNRPPESPNAIPKRSELIEVRSDLLTTTDERAGTARELLTLLTPALRAVGLAKKGELLHA